MGRWGFRLFQGDSGLDTRSDIEATIVVMVEDEKMAAMILDTAEKREIAKKILQVDGESDQLYLTNHIDDPGVRKILDSCVCEALFKTYRGDKWSEIIFGAMMMQAGARIKKGDLKRLRKIVSYFPYGDTELPENGFENVGQAQFAAAVDNYQAGVPRNFDTASCDQCGMIEDDISHKLLECPNCTLSWWCDEAPNADKHGEECFGFAEKHGSRRPHEPGEGGLSLMHAFLRG
ncbi:hypothetical protein M406DRAFT_330436 [Cryphonectria parasitica EP155]|uniref:Suppressor of anucleate metulae protein B n=1 Tax=Cryphonectria parasitica (strain ATCC 38755 / EP155) TaxID=660469 RepID=A0A9P4Y030_CRYP1|nr:uncharacterized protein M406DRAFT_330436 [Cryphonectria parasitica EP155]KAF3764086.1 hypothetical protein M406DRAFT_330436 [Cryphonectria parasitica EP155]